MKQPWWKVALSHFSDVHIEPARSAEINRGDPLYPGICELLFQGMLFSRDQSVAACVDR